MCDIPDIKQNMVYSYPLHVSSAYNLTGPRMRLQVLHGQKASAPLVQHLKMLTPYPVPQIARKLVHNDASTTQLLYA